MGSQEEWKILAEWHRDYQQNFRIEALNIAEEEQVLLCLSQMEPCNTQQDWFSLKVLADMVNAEYNPKVSCKCVSNVFHRLGLTKRKKLHGYTVAFVPHELLEKVLEGLVSTFLSYHLHKLYQVNLKKTIIGY